MRFQFILCTALVGLLISKRANAASVNGYSVEDNDNTTEDEEQTPTSNIQPKCFKQSYQINAAGDLRELSDCSIISGDILISGYDDTVLDFGSISHIKGSLRVHNASSLLRIQGVELNAIDGTFGLNSLTSLTSISLPKLESIDTLEWKVLPILSLVNLDKGIKHINSVIMSDTSLTGFGGFNVESLKILNINNNRFLERIESSVKEVTESFLISANARTLQVSLPNLSWVKSITIKDTSNLNLNNLQIVENNAQFINNKFSQLKLPKLKSAGSTLSIINNQNLNKLDFPALVEIGGGLMVIDNDQVSDIDFFPALKSVGGAIEFQGNINDSQMEQLRIVKGSAIMKSSSSNFDCNKWINYEVSGVVRGGKIECGSGNSTVTEVLLVDEAGDITRGAPGVNSRINDDYSTDIRSGSATLVLSMVTVIAGLIISGTLMVI
ncbi:hypothetical protein CANARDRAFT_26247 [[Candida] arabinofermentans NRRL YB-2248]|uniref:Receptor L-domain domain-containing protein n=1 Tax=[Candida] arabinofermentans NRRL YB-2248 TaxID=983967 RepID=A0A1E4T8M3_9ASCO|nr:hypothetical protein CANARDRAFT_26247 [[Candida] arabinofermentans NRRL YB-2248]